MGAWREECYKGKASRLVQQLSESGRNINRRLSLARQVKAGHGIACRLATAQVLWVFSISSGKIAHRSLNTICRKIKHSLSKEDLPKGMTFISCGYAQLISALTSAIPVVARHPYSPDICAFKTLQSWSSRKSLGPLPELASFLSAWRELLGACADDIRNIIA